MPVVPVVPVIIDAPSVLEFDSNRMAVGRADVAYLVQARVAITRKLSHDVGRRRHVQRHVTPHVPFPVPREPRQHVRRGSRVSD